MRLTCLPAGPVWMGDEGAAQHLAGQLVGFRDRAGEADAALFAGLGFLEVALAATARMDLRLDHPERAVESACRGLGLFGLQHHAAVRNRGAEAAQKRLGLIFVDVHASCPVCVICGLMPQKKALSKPHLPVCAKPPEKSDICDHRLENCDHN